MIIDFVIGIVGMIIGVCCGFSWGDSLLIFFAAYIVDADILINEFIRIFIKKEKKLNFSNFLDEYSYTHKFLFHLPLLALPLAFAVATLCLNWLFGLLIAGSIFFHFVHDTMDKNFDGVSWLWPFNKNSYKLRGCRIDRLHWEIKTREQLKREAEKKIPRNTGGIIKSNK